MRVRSAEIYIRFQGGHATIAGKFIRHSLIGCKPTGNRGRFAIPGAMVAFGRGVLGGEIDTQPIERMSSTALAGARPTTKVCPRNDIT